MARDEQSGDTFERDNPGESGTLVSGTPGGAKGLSVRTALVVLSLLFMVLAGLLVTYRWSERYFLSEVAEQGRDSLNLYAENIHGWLNRYRSLPRIYAENPFVFDLLRYPTSRSLTEAVNDYLTEWNLATGAADTYLMSRSGSTVAASNWDQEATFVGQNFAYRPYFTQALEGRLGRFFALGTTSNKRGYYFSYPVWSEAGVLGITVVKVGVGEIEQKLEASPHPIFVTDPNGVILLAGNPDWRLKLLTPLDTLAREDISQTRQFDLARLSSLGPFGAQLEGGGDRLVTIPSAAGQAAQEMLHLSLPMANEDWTLNILVDTTFARNQMLTTVLLVGSLFLGIGLIVALVWQRRHRLVELLRERERAQATLEKTVDERTADLRASNLQLADEVNERRLAEEELQRTQHELVQAGKLAALGQMSAALSHEFNQPLAAIRTYAENAGLLFDRGRDGDAQENIRHIVSLTERMADLSKHLSSFARKPQDQIRPVSLNSALDESLRLLKGRLEAAGLRPEINAPESALWVQGGHIRLQQVIINLITNALDAMKGVDHPRLLIGLAKDKDHVLLSIEDNGHGLCEESREKIFDPFFTTKEVGKGLGLGLSISFNIIKDFGGSITARNGAAGGAEFTITLKAAEPVPAKGARGEAAE